MIYRVIALAGFAFSISTNASIVSLNSSFGSDTITRDTNSGLEWLDVTVTRGLSYGQVTAGMTAGGAYEGWRYATVAELDQLIVDFGYVAVLQNCGYSSLHCDYGLSGNPPEVAEMILTLGDVGDAYLDEVNDYYDVAPGGAGYTQGMLGEWAPDPSHSVFTSKAVIGVGNYVIRATGEPRVLSGGDRYTVESLSSSAAGKTDQNPRVGSWLVRDYTASPVPVPASVWAFASALIGLVSLKRRT